MKWSSIQQRKKWYKYIRILLGPFSSLDSKRSCSPRQIPRNGRSFSIYVQRASVILWKIDPCETRFDLSNKVKNLVNYAKHNAWTRIQKLDIIMNSNFHELFLHHRPLSFVGIYSAKNVIWIQLIKQRKMLALTKKSNNFLFMVWKKINLN